MSFILNLPLARCSPFVNDELRYIVEELNHTIENMPELERIPDYNSKNKYRYMERCRNSSIAPEKFIEQKKTDQVDLSDKESSDQTAHGPGIKEIPLSTSGGGLKMAQHLTNISTMEKDINELRIHLNKITPQKQDEMTYEFIEKLKCCVVFYKQMANWERVKDLLCQMMFQTFIGSELYAETYAEVYKQITKEFPELSMSDYLNKKIDEYFNEMKKMIHIENTEEQYDDFCKQNRENAFRKNTSMFIVYLYKKEIITATKLMDLIESIFQFIETHIQLPNFLEEIKVMTENVYLLSIHTHARLKQSVEQDHWYDDLEPMIYKLEAMSADKKNPSTHDSIMYKFKTFVEVIEA